MVGNLPDLVNQGFPLDISNEDRELILSYQPAQADWDDDKFSNFLEKLRIRNPEPQCKFCSENPTISKIFSTTKKIKIVKKPV